MIAKNKVVSIEYTLTDENSQVLDSSDGRAPLAYLHGVGGIIPGLEKALEGKQVGDELEVVVPPSEGYGERDEALRQEVERSHFADVDDLAVGMQFRVESNNGDMVVTVVHVGDETVTIDGNHQLAGMTLNFAVKVREIRDATQEELDHGHAHSAGGHSH